MKLTLFIIGVLLTGDVHAQFERSMIRSEIVRHVIDECDLYLLYGKNKIDFDPYEVGVKILPDLRDRNFVRQDRLTNEIYEAVKNVKSFYKRAKMYDVYYGICIDQITVTVALKKMSEIAKMKIVEQIVNRHDRNISMRFSSANDDDKVERDQSRIRLLQLINAREKVKYIIEKNLSVIQEYHHDIDLWRF